MQPAKAYFLVEGSSDAIAVQYNPNEFTLEKLAQIAEIAIPGLDSPLQQYIHGQTEKLTLELFFDTTDFGTGAGAISVTTETDKIYELIKIDPASHAPPILTFLWNADFPGGDIGNRASAAASGTLRARSSAMLSAQSASGPLASANGSAGGGSGAMNSPLTAQRRKGFRCIMESIRQRFSLFSPEGVPLRATLSVTLREYKNLDDQLGELRTSRTDRVLVHAIAAGETLASIAHRHLGSPDRWRLIADSNGIDDPRRILPDRLLDIETPR